MKLLSLIALFALITTMVNGAWWATAAVQPVIVSIGAILSSIDLDVLDIQSIDLKKWFSSKDDKDDENDEFIKDAGAAIEDDDDDGGFLHVPPKEGVVYDGKEIEIGEEDDDPRYKEKNKIKDMDMRPKWGPLYEYYDKFKAKIDAQFKAEGIPEDTRSEEEIFLDKLDEVEVINKKKKKHPKK